MRITGKYYTVVIMTSFLSNSHYLTVNGPFSDTKLFDNEDVSKGREVSGWGGGGGGGRGVACGVGLSKSTSSHYL